MKALKEQLRQKEEQLQANQQQSSLLSAELRDASSARDRTMSELYHMKLEADALRQAKAEAQAQCVHLELLVEQMKAEAKKEAVRMSTNIHLRQTLQLILLCNRRCSFSFSAYTPIRIFSCTPLMCVWILISLDLFYFEELLGLTNGERCTAGSLILEVLLNPTENGYPTSLKGYSTHK